MTEIQLEQRQTGQRGRGHGHAAGRYMWLAVWCATLGWDALLPHIESAASKLALVSLLAAGVLLVRRDRIHAVGSAPATSTLAALLFAVVAVLLPWPERLGPVLLAAAAMLRALPLVRQLGRGNVWYVPAALGALLVVLATAGHLYRLLEAYAHDLDFLAVPVATIYRLLGHSAAADPPFVHLQGLGIVHSIDCSTEKIFGHAWFGFSVASLALLLGLPGRSKARRALVFLGAVLLFALVRFMSLGLVLDESDSASNWYLRAWTFGSLLGLVALLMAACPPLVTASGMLPGTPAGHVPAPAGASRFGRWRGAPAWCVAFALVFGIATAGVLGWFDRGSPKTGRVLIDERHSNWEWSTIDLDTLSYGVQTVYNYSELVRYLGFWYDVAANLEIIDDGVLAQTDVLILKTPTRPYADAEVDAIQRFVAAGGGLWLIGDHTNVFGMSTNLNKVARRFGLRYRYDAAVDLLTFGRQLFERPRLFAHPVIRHLPPMLMATSCTLVAPPLGQPVMVGRSLLSDELDYSTNTFFGDFRPQPDEPFGSMLQSIAVHHGRGRVLTFSDSTIFSNFFMFIRGKPELALGSVRWLMCTNRHAWIRHALVALMLGSFVVALVLAHRLPRVVALSGLAAALLGFAVTARGLDAWVARWSRLPEPRQPLPYVVFERGRSAYDLPDLGELPDESPTSFHTFYVWTQRVGLVPMTRLFEHCFEDNNVTVLINPFEHFTHGEVEQVRAWVQNGGKLLVLDSPRAHHSTASVLLQPFGLSFAAAVVDTVMVRWSASGDSIATLAQVKAVEGGDALLLLPDGRAALAVKSEGRGRVVAMCASDSFTDAVLGTTSVVPDAAQLALYRLQFRLFVDLLRPDEHASASHP